MDEATSLSIARMPILEMFSHLQKNDVHPPLYFLLLHFWRMGGEGPFFLRFLSALIGSLTIPAVYLLGRRMFGARAAMVCALLLGLAPLHISYSQVVRGYSFFILLTVLSFFFLLTAIDRNTTKSWTIYGMAALASLLTHYHAMLALSFQNLMAGLFILVPKGSRSKWRNWGMANVVAGVLFLAWLTQSAVFSGSLSPSWLSAESRPVPATLISTLVQFSLGPAGWSFPSWALKTGAILFSSILIMASLGGKKRVPLSSSELSPEVMMMWGYFLLPIITTWIISQGKNIYVVRYLSPFLIPYILLLGVGIATISLGWLRALVTVTAISIFLWGSWLTYTMVQHQDWRAVSSYICSSAHPGDIVVVSPPWYQRVLDYYAKGRISYYPKNDSGPAEICRDATTNSGRLWLVEVDVRHWRERSSQLRYCLDSRFQMIDQTGFGPGHNWISLYLTRAK